MAESWDSTDETSGKTKTVKTKEAKPKTPAVTAKEETAHTTESNTHIKPGNRKIFEKIYPSTKARMDALLRSLPPSNYEYTAGDQDLKWCLEDSLLQVGLPKVFLTTTINEQEISLVREKLPGYGKFVTQFNQSDLISFYEAGKVYPVIEGEALDADTMEPAPQSVKKGIKTTKVTPAQRYREYATLLLAQPFWKAYRRETFWKISRVCGSEATLADYMSTYCACVELARNKSLLSQVRSHFRITEDVESGDFAQAIAMLYEQRRLEHVNEPIENLKKWSKRPDPSSYHTGGEALNAIITRFHAKKDFLIREAKSIYGLDLKQDVSYHFEMLQGGIPPEISQVLNAINPDKMFEITMTDEANEMLRLLENAVNNQRSRAVLVPYTANASRNLITVKKQNHSVLNKEKEYVGNYYGFLLKFLKEEAVPEELLEKVRSAYSIFKNKSRNGRKFNSRQQAHSTSQVDGSRKESSSKP